MLEPAVERAATRGAIGATRARSRIFFVRTPGVRVFELAERASDYNTPRGAFAKHFWFHGSLRALAHVRALARDTNASSVAAT